jgi:hypothetical protein
MIAYKLTLEQANLLKGKTLTQDNYFWVIKDINGDKFITQSQVDECTNKDFAWVKDLPKFEFIKPNKEK